MVTKTATCIGRKMLITDFIEGPKIPFHVISSTTEFVLNVRMMIYGSQKVRLPPVNAWNKKEPVVIMVSISNYLNWPSFNDLRNNLEIKPTTVQDEQSSNNPVVCRKLNRTLFVLNIKLFSFLNSYVFNAPIKRISSSFIPVKTNWICKHNQQIK